MTLYELFRDWDEISRERKVERLQSVVDFIKRDSSGDETLLYEILSISYDFEEDDYFGTEGLR